MPTVSGNSSASSPSAVLAESLAVLSTSAHQAFAEVENRARQDVAKANSDAHAARLERDKALEAFRAAQLEAQELQKEVASTKATLNQTELSVSHQKETIAQLRREAMQWKDQSHNWQEHFLRVEQERCSLTTRIEELASERFQWSRSLPTPFTPNHPAVNTNLSVTPPKLRQSSISSHKRPISPPEVDLPSTSISGHKFSRILSKPIQAIHKKDSTPTQKLLFHDSSTSTSNQNSNVQSTRTRQSSPSNLTRSLARTTVLRRVHAVIDVKQEEEQSDKESEHLAAEETMKAPNPRRVPPRKRKAVYHKDDYASNEESDRAVSGDDQHEDNGVIDDEDDELMLGGQAHEDERGRASKSAPGRYIPSSLPSKKRKITAVGNDKPLARRKNQSS
ncbi:hypothetical protein J132_11394 [Termitomyces sp. J132]|nr:hypothetical protein H2248_007516 [Termitomyces sp. 'cryptogamus']KNZ81575.1 hypothetical protein J132_11394 [Termitomyces sp. J132]